MKKLNLVSVGSVLLLLCGCAQLHHVQVGEIDARKGELKPFEIKVSETGVDLNDVKAMSRATMSKEGSNSVKSVMETIQYFQMGPKTGAGVFSYAYANNLEKTLRKECPSGRVTGLLMIREARKYPVISGEIVKVKGYCQIGDAT
ncbi:MAG: hypothetical protein AB7O96_05775 [Pseudobdellovibrionaceae bacterium]